MRAEVATPPGAAFYSVARLLYKSRGRSAKTEQELKKIFITGASAGIGEATARHLAARGHEVWGSARDAARLPAGLHAVTLDLTEPVAEVFQSAWTEAGGFDVVINNAGSGHFGAVEYLTRAQLLEQFQMLVFAQVELCQLALAAMRAQGGGLIINVTSLASRLPVPFMGAYNAAKAAMASITMTLQLEAQGTAVRFVDLQPGDIRTRFNDVLQKSEPSLYQASAERVWQVSEKNMKAAPTPDLIARRIAGLIDDPNPPARVTVGEAFQVKIAPAIFALLPPRLRVWGLRRYYKI